MTRGDVSPALDALARFRRGGGAVVLISNAAEPGEGLTLTLAARGIADVFDGLVSAGDVTRAGLREKRPDSILYIGSDRDRRVIDGIPAGRGRGGADVIVCTGYPEDDADLDAVLGEAHRRGVPMLCTNPDTSLVAGGRLLRFAGLVAQRYRELGGAVTDNGKPGSRIYAAALAVAREATGRSFDPGASLARRHTRPRRGRRPRRRLRGGAVDTGGSRSPERPGPGRRYRLPTLTWGQSP